MAPLRLNATISDRRITIIFSHKASAINYDKYLQSLDDSFYEKHNCELAKSGDRISLDLPADITAETNNRFKDVTLVFADAEAALTWERKMILWRERLPQANKRRLSRAFAVELFSGELARARPQADLEFLVPTILADIHAPMSNRRLRNLTSPTPISFTKGSRSPGRFEPLSAGKKFLAILRRRFRASDRDPMVNEIGVGDVIEAKLQ